MSGKPRYQTKGTNKHQYTTTSRPLQIMDLLYFDNIDYNVTSAIIHNQIYKLTV